LILLTFSAQEKMQLLSTFWDLANKIKPFAIRLFLN
jgi:hypothetical protein